VSNVLSEEKKQQVIALGRLGWSVRRIEAAVHIRRETIAGYLRGAGIAVRPPDGDGAHRQTGHKVVADSGVQVPIAAAEAQPAPSSSASACEPYRDLVELATFRRKNNGFIQRL
jgi:hypothetical protein